MMRLALWLEAVVHNNYLCSTLYFCVLFLRLTLWLMNSLSTTTSPAAAAAYYFSALLLLNLHTLANKFDFDFCCYCMHFSSISLMQISCFACSAALRMHYFHSPFIFHTLFIICMPIKDNVFFSYTMTTYPHYVLPTILLNPRCFKMAKCAICAIVCHLWHLRTPWPISQKYYFKLYYLLTYESTTLRNSNPSSKSLCSSRVSNLQKTATKERDLEREPQQNLNLQASCS